MMKKERGNELYFSLKKLCSTLIATTIKCLCVKNNSESSYGREKMISFFLSNDGWRERKKKVMERCQVRVRKEEDCGLMWTREKLILK